MTTATIERYSSMPSGNSFLVYSGLSILLHVGLLGVLSFFNTSKTLENPVPLVNVTLVESRTPEPVAGKSGNPAPPPPMRQANRENPKTTSKPATSRSPQLKLVSQRMLMPASHLLVPSPKIRKQITPAPRRVLQDHKAADALTMRNLLKVATSKGTAKSDHRPQPQANLNATTFLGAAAPIPGIARTHSASTAMRETETGHSSPRTLTAHPPGKVKVSNSKVGLGRTIPPVYPHVAREEGWEGTVLVRVVVQPDGQPSVVRIRRSSGHTVLDEAAIDAVWSWQFIPARDGNIPIKSVVDIPINFDLRKHG